MDPWFIVDSARDSTPLLQAARHVNDLNLRSHETILSEAKRGSARAICCLGLSYKADIDLRESPSIDIVDMVSRRFEGQLFVIEPHIEALPRDLQAVPNLVLSELRDGLDRSDMVVLLTDHKAFRDISADDLKNKKIIDTRGVWRSIV